MFAASALSDPLPQIRSWLAEDRADGLPWQPEQFAQYVVLASREVGAGRTWVRAIIDATPAWRDSYLGIRAGHLAQFSVDLLLDDGDAVRENLDDPGGI